MYCVVVYFCMGYIGGCLHKYYSTKQFKGSDLIDAIGWGFLGPMIYLAYFIAYMDTKVLIKQRVRIKYEEDNNIIN